MTEVQTNDDPNMTTLPALTTHAHQTTETSTTVPEENSTSRIITPLFQTTVDSSYSDWSSCSNQSGVTKIFGECLIDANEYFSFVIGLVAVVFWMLANTSMVRVKWKDGNFRLIQMVYVVYLLAGDSCNLVGTIINNQLGTQIFTAIVLVASDLVLVAQTWYFWFLFRRTMTKGEILNNNWGTQANNSRQRPNGTVLAVCCMTLWSFGLLYQPISLLHSSKRSWSSYDSPRTGRKLLMVGNSDPETLGFVLGGLSAFVYSSVRLILIKDVFHRRELMRKQGPFHILAGVANVLYVISILSYHGSHSDDAINAVPWIVGGVILAVEDLIIAVTTYRLTKIKPRSGSSTRREDGTLLLNGGDDLVTSVEIGDAQSIHSRRTPMNVSGLPAEPNTQAMEVTGLTEFQAHDPHSVAVKVISKPQESPSSPPHQNQANFMSKEELPRKPDRTVNKNDFDDLEWDFADMTNTYEETTPDWEQGSWDEEKVLRAIEKELEDADEDDSSTMSLSSQSQTDGVLADKGYDIIY